MFESFSIYDVMQLVGYSSAKLRGSHAYYDCPHCGKEKKFNINVTLGYGGVCRCWKCGVGGDKLDLYVLATRPNCALVTTQSKSGKSLYLRPSEEDRKEALKELADRLHIARSKPGYLHKIEKAKNKAVATAVKESYSTRSPEEISAVYTALLRLLKLSDAHKKKLLERGLTEEDIERNLFRSTPQFGRTQLAQKLVSQGYKLDNISGFFKIHNVDKETGEVTEEWSVYCPDSGYFVPIRNKDGYIVSMQIRLNKPTTAKDKYRFFSSSVDTLAEGTTADSAVHVEMCSETPRYLYVVEGAIKAYVAHALYKRLYKKDDLIIFAVPGTSNLGRIPSLMEWAAKFDFENVVEFYDLDKYTNEYVARDRKNLEMLLKKSMREWLTQKANQYKDGTISPPKYISFPRERYLGKGIDDHLKAVYDLKTRGEMENENAKA